MGQVGQAGPGGKSSMKGVRRLTDINFLSSIVFCLLYDADTLKLYSTDSTDA